MTAGPGPARPRELAERLGPPETLVVLVDHDGTLSPIAPRPEDAVLAEGAVAALSALAERAPVVVVSGRSLDDLVARLGHLPVAIAANHGATLRDRAGHVRWLVDPGATTDVLAEVADRLGTLVDPTSGWLVEAKDVSVTVHHRRVDADEVARLLPRVRALLEEVVAEERGLELLDGRAVLELRVAGADKGDAVREFMAHAPGRRPLVLGDDVTDEDMFRAARELGGTAVLVAAHERASAASVRLTDPAAVVELLARLAVAPGTGPGIKPAG